MVAAVGLVVDGALERGQRAVEQRVAGRRELMRDALPHGVGGGAREAIGEVPLVFGEHVDGEPAGVAQGGQRLAGLAQADVVLDGLDLDLSAGEFVALLGRSGSGKTTLLRALAGLDRGVTGDIQTGGTPAVVFQEPRLLPWRDVITNVALGLRDPNPRKRAKRALAEVGLEGREDAWPRQLSGGQRQRVALARALVREPDLMLLADRVLIVDEGRIAYDERFELERPRRRDHPDLVTRRRELLERLGVDDDR